MGAETVLVIDDDSERRRHLKHLLDFVDYQTAEEAALTEWTEAAEGQETVQAVFLAADSLDEADRERERINEQLPRTPVVYYSADGGEAPKGVVGHLAFPPDYNSLVIYLHRAHIYRERLRRRNATSSADLRRALVGCSPAMEEVRRLIEQVADSEATVLILGESGTGKEVVAQGLHYLSSRRERAFVPVNCGAIPGDLLESELFGHEKGAFTGAITARQGRFELAEGGTLFLDEIGDMPLAMQVKLLRVIQERTFERVGSNKSLNADVRIVAATHRDLDENIRDGSFREDLFYRLNVFPIEVPPLRERREDIPLLVNEFISRLDREGRGSVRLTPTATASLAAYHWPGNVRELANLIERLVIMYPASVVDIGDLPQKFRSEEVDLPDLPELPDIAEADEADAEMPSGPVFSTLPENDFDLKEHLADLEMGYIQQALDQAEGVVAHAAKRLKMRRTTLVEKMRKYGLQRADAS